MGAKWIFSTKSTFGYKTKRGLEKMFYIYSKKKVLNNSFFLYPDRSKVDSDRSEDIKCLIQRDRQGNFHALRYKIHTLQIQYLIRQS